MASSGTGSAKRRQQRDRERAAELKRLGIERVSCRCAQCYKIISCEGPKSKYNHVCKK